jgi:hypothetical protein
VGWVSGPGHVVEFHSSANAGLIEQIAADYIPEWVELRLSDVEFSSVSRPIFAYTSIALLDLDKLKHVAEKIEFLVLDLDNVDPFEYHELIRKISDMVKILLCVNPDIKDVGRVIHELPISGLALKGSKELKTGLKEYDYSDLLEALDADD